VVRTVVDWRLSTWVWLHFHFVKANDAHRPKKYSPPMMATQATANPCFGATATGAAHRHV
jgi:hypothetical protein